MAIFQKVFYFAFFITFSIYIKVFFLKMTNVYAEEGGHVHFISYAGKELQVTIWVKGG